MSCQSCHSGGHTNGLLTDNFTDESYRSPKRVLSLLGQANTSPYSWAGTMQTLEDQIAFSIKSTMASDNAVRSKDVHQIAEYVRTLQRPPSIVEARSEANSPVRKTKRVSRGERIFRSVGCIDCHREPFFTSEDVYDVGLQDERSMRAFNPPSLIGLSQRQNALFHDGRAKSIRDVIWQESHQLPDHVTRRERNVLIEYLMSL
jgi:cytochrome c peroxidase